MTNLKNTKRALISSVVALCICFSMLLGTTYAWFTDSASSNENKIESGTLDIKLKLWKSATDFEEITSEDAPLFGGNNPLVDNSLWEPNKTQIVYLSLENVGSLDLKYAVALEVYNVTKNLHEAMEYAIFPDAQFGDITTRPNWETLEADQNITPAKVKIGTNKATASDVKLESDGEHFFALAIHMNQDADNDYTGGSVSFDLKVLAGQIDSEVDSFGSDYDKLAGYAYPGYGSAPVDPTNATSAYEVPIRDENDAKLGSAVIPAEAVADDAEDIEVNITETVYNGNFTIDADLESKAFDVNVSGLKENNDVPVKIQLRIAAGLDPLTVKVYHKDALLNANAYSYNPHTGYVTFESATFSPFTVVFDEDSVYNDPADPVVPDDTPADLPKATVVNSPEYENVDLDWGKYGSWSPTKGLDSQLEAAYTFSCKDTLEQAKLNKYANWFCDFYVKLNRDLGENEIFLGGNYGEFGWVGFHNGDLTLEADTEIPLLGSVTTNPWTYVDVVQNVGSFICGVGDVGDALAGATFTVMLRLTNPENSSEYYNVATINYTFN